MKTIRASILAFAGLNLAACGGLSQKDIQDALKTESAPTSSLNYRVGESWTANEVVTTKGKGAVLGGSDVQYKYEDGKAVPCEPNAARQNNTNCGIVQTAIRVATTTYSAKVTEKADTAVTKTPGFVVVEASTFTIDEQRYYPVTNTQETSNFPQNGVIESLYTLTERDNFISKITEGGESDLGASTALWPSHPANGRTYTDDAGMSWAFTSGTVVKLASRTVSALAATVATPQTPLETLASLKTKCFSRQPAGGVSTTNTDIVRHGDCSGNIQLVYDRRVVIGRDLKLRETLKSVVINITDWGVRDNLGVLRRTIPNTNGGDVVFLYDAVETESTFGVTDVTF